MGKKEKRKERADPSKAKGNPKNDGRLRASGGRKSRNLVIISIAVVAIAAVVGVLFFLNQTNPQQPSASSSSTLAIDGISCDSTEHLVYHSHAHVDIFVNGQSYQVPGRIGIEPSKQCLFWLHTHSDDGVIHMESPENRIMTLGNFFDIWQRTASDVDQFPKPPANDISSPTLVYVNGEKVLAGEGGENDLREIKILPTDEIAIAYGSELPSSMIPTSYAFGKTDIKIDASNSDLVHQILAPPTSGSGPLGDANAPVTIVEFGDYQCNSCGIFHRATKDAVMANLVDTGKAKFLFKDFTLNDYILDPTKGSTLAAEAAYCAGEQGKFWEYHDELYKNQKHEGIVWISLDALKGFASNIGVKDSQQFSDCLDSHKYTDTVSANNDLVKRLRLDGTPTFIIIPNDAEGKNPVKLVGAYPYDAFEAVVNQLAP